MLKAQVVYFPQYGFGHIGIQVEDIASGQKRFFDFGGTHDLVWNQHADYYGKPIFIDLPPKDMLWDNFLKAIEPTCYNATQRDVFPEQEHYGLLTNNCAHATQQILHMLGYITQKPLQTFALTPYAIARQAADIAQQNRDEFCQQVLATVNATIPAERMNAINVLINKSIERLTKEAELANSVNYISPQHQLLLDINYDNSSEAMDRLLLAYECADEKMARELQFCLGLLPADACLKVALARLDQGADNLAKRGFTEDGACAKNLKNNLTAMKDLLDQKKINYETFEYRANNAIAKALPKLEKHRGYKRMLGNLALAVVGMGVLYLLAISVNKIMTGNLLFFSKTRSATLVDEIKKEIKGPTSRH
jgi:hypothetical protein